MSKLTMSKEEFIHFVRKAISDRRSDEFVELYNHLLRCFSNADTDHDGKVSVAEFDHMVEDAAALPRAHGYAPKTSDLYKDDSSRLAARKAQFNKIDTNQDGHISFDEWLKYSVDHIYAKVSAIKPHILEDGSKDEFVAFIKKAVNTSSGEYKELYYFLLKVFADADKDYDGQISVDEFDNMIERAAAMPRKYGLAPKSSELYKSDGERKDARKKQFGAVDMNGDGHISFDEWLAYSLKHITSKVSGL